MHRARWLLPVVAVALASAGCESSAKPSGAPSATTAAASPTPSGSDDDQLPAIEVKPTAPPKYSLAKLSELELAALTTKNGWTTTVVGKTPGHGSESAIRVAAFKKDAAGNLECVVSVRCSDTGSPSMGDSATAPAFEHLPGVAYYTQASCELKVEVRRGIRKKSAESKRLLEQLLVSQPG